MSLSFEELASRWKWRAIPGCPGRYSLSPAVFAGKPEDLLSGELPVRKYRSAHAPDAISVAAIKGGGLISYHKADGRFIHTLNTSEGFRRKLQQLEVEWDGESAD